MKPRKERAGAGFPPLELTALDPSTGNAKKLFRMTIAGDQQMTAKLSPPGLDARTREALADATLDAVQLPGTHERMSFILPSSKKNGTAPCWRRSRVSPQMAENKTRAEEGVGAGNVGSSMLEGKVIVLSRC
jgi:hypothetical protein